MASGLQWMCKTWKVLAVVAGLLEGLWCPWGSVVCQAGFRRIACYNVELLSKFDVNVLPCLCTYQYGKGLISLSRSFDSSGILMSLCFLYWNTDESLLSIFVFFEEFCVGLFSVAWPAFLLVTVGCSFYSLKYYTHVNITFLGLNLSAQLLDYNIYALSGVLAVLLLPLYLYSESRKFPPNFPKGWSIYFQISSRRETI